MKKIVAIALLSASMLLAGPKISPEVKSLLSQAKSEVSGVSAEELNEMLKKENIILLDVRNPNEWANGTIKADKVVTISRGFLEVKYPKLILDKYSKDDKFVAYCGIEPRSVLAAKTLKDLGFKNVQYLKSGYNNWKKSGFEVTKK